MSIDEEERLRERALAAEPASVAAQAKMLRGNYQLDVRRICLDPWSQLALTEAHWMITNVRFAEPLKDYYRRIGISSDGRYNIVGARSGRMSSFDWSIMYRQMLRWVRPDDASIKARLAERLSISSLDYSNIEELILRSYPNTAKARAEFSGLSIVHDEVTVDPEALAESLQRKERLAALQQEEQHGT